MSIIYRCREINKLIRFKSIFSLILCHRLRSPNIFFWVVSLWTFHGISDNFSLVLIFIYPRSHRKRDGHRVASLFSFSVNNLNNLLGILGSIFRDESTLFRSFCRLSDQNHRPHFATHSKDLILFISSAYLFLWFYCLGREFLHLFHLYLTLVSNFQPIYF